MSLQVWLPLTGDLQNSGLADVTMENHGATIDNSGKIGKCYSFDRSNSQYITGGDVTIPQMHLSAACWFYPIEWTDNAHNYIFGMNTSASNDFLWCICLYNGLPSARLKGTTVSHTDEIELNRWHHMAVTYDGTNIRLYLNGSLIKITAYTVNTPSTATKIWLATRGGLGSTCFSGKINDCRIYDHVISAKEVKELSKALVIHETLNDPLFGTGFAIDDLLAYGSGGPRHKTHAVLNGTMRKNLDKIFESDALSSEFTITLWVRQQDSSFVTNAYIYQGIVDFYIHANDGKIYITWQHANESLSYNNKNTWAPGFVPPVGEWVMLTCTFKDGCLYLYVNGEYYWISDRSDRGLFIKGQYSPSSILGSNSIGFIGDLSDFRCYMTALSADDILELYQTSCSIDHGGNLYVYDICEDDNGIKVLANGVVEADEFDETIANIDHVSFYKDGTIAATSLNEY